MSGLAIGNLGEGSLQESLQQQIDALHLSSVVHLKGVSHSIDEVYSHSSFFVMSSLYERIPVGIGGGDELWLALC